MIPPEVIEESDLKDVFGYNSEYKCVEYLHVKAQLTHFVSRYLCILGLHSKSRAYGAVLPTL